MTTPLLTPTMVSAWLACDHTITLTREVAAGRLPAPDVAFGSFSRMLMDKGLAHENDCLERYRAQELSILEVPAKRDDERFEEWAERSQGLLANGSDVVVQMPLVHDGFRGVADFLVRVDQRSALGAFAYEPVDAKLARIEAAPGHVLQLCFYADALEQLQGTRPRAVHLELGAGHRERLVLATVDAYWRRVRTQLQARMTAPAVTTVARPCAHCDLCAFQHHCTSEWEQRDALYTVAGITSRDVERLEGDGIDTFTALATLPDTVEVDGLRPERLTHLRRQAALQRRADPESTPPVEVLDHPAEDEEAAWAASLPEPDPGDVFFDIEGHPFWQPAHGLVFLFGLRYRDEAGTWIFEPRWAHDRDEEAEQVRSLIDWLVHRRADHPSMHVFHYNHTERSMLERLTAEHGVAESALTLLIEQGVFVDLYRTVRATVRVGAPSYSLKVLELVAGYERGHDLDQGSGAVVEYDAWATDGDTARLERIARYNDDDVRATHAVRDWLLTEPLAGRPPRTRPDKDDATDDTGDTERVIDALLATTEPWKHLLAHLLGYWWREWRTTKTQTLAVLDTDNTQALIDHEQVVAGLEFVEYIAPTGKQRTGRARFRFPPQPLGSRLAGGGPRNGTLTFRAGPDLTPMVGVDALDPSGSLTVAWPNAATEAGSFPDAMIAIESVNAKPKPAALLTFAQRVLDEETAPIDHARIALLQRQLPQFKDGGGPVDGHFDGRVEQLVDAVCHLDDSVLTVQGPPGTGKTYAGAKMIGALIADGQSVGITAFSHKAIDNLLTEVLEQHPGTTAIRAVTKAPVDAPDGVTYLSNSNAAKRWDPASYDVIAGTTWLFARDDLTASRGPLDVLVIDEAGQLSLADALAAMGSARNVVLLGDPLQLPQVIQAAHPGGADASVLEHVLGDAATLPAERGAFLPTTRRMHPTITRFLSDRIYDGRLEAHGSCANQHVDGRTGLRWIRAEHQGRTIRSPEEASIVSELVADLVGRQWMDASGRQRPLTAADIMVVAPYNDQVNLLSDVLDADDVTRGARVGTVDRFQGQQAAVVVFTMATSSGDDIPRGTDFLFSRNRLNVAISRARALAYVVCTDELLNTRARDVDDIALIGTLCALVEAAADHEDDQA